MAKILVVDDEASIRGFVKLALQGEGYEVLTAADGAEALEVLGEGHPALILLDLRMRGMNGSQFLEAYRKLSGRKAPVVLMTAGREDMAEKVEADDYLNKPFELDDLLDVVAKQLKQSSSS